MITVSKAQEGDQITGIIRISSARQQPPTEKKIIITKLETLTGFNVGITPELI